MSQSSNLPFFCQLFWGKVQMSFKYRSKCHHAALLFVYCLGKLSAAASFVLVYLITIELYPTNLRTQVECSPYQFERKSGYHNNYFGHENDFSQSNSETIIQFSGSVSMTKGDRNKFLC